MEGGKREERKDGLLKLEIKERTLLPNLETKSVIREYYVQLNANKLDNLD